MKILAIVLTALFLLTVLIVISAIFVGRRSRPAHEENKRRYIYRDEPHADQLTESPNRLNENEITRG